MVQGVAMSAFAPMRVISINQCVTCWVKMMRTTTSTTCLVMVLTASTLSAVDVHPFPHAITSLKLGTPKTVVTSALAAAGFPCHTTWVGHDPHEIGMPPSAVSNGIKSVRIEFAGGTLSDITIDIDHDKIDEEFSFLYMGSDK